VRPTFRYPMRLSTPVRLTIGTIILLLIGSIVLVSRAGATATPPSIPGLGTIQMRDTGLLIAAPNMSPAIDRTKALKALPDLPDNAHVLQVVARSRPGPSPWNLWTPRLDGISRRPATSEPEGLTATL
jgi:hypothetical protein